MNGRLVGQVSRRGARLGGGLAPLGGDGKTLGGHKGYGLGLFAQILGSTLGGGSFSPVRNRTQKSDEPDNIGHFFLAVMA
ncbi:Ldh family oxidoreductase [Paraburkholderia phytofirmans]|uniref:Ldh family oxidoreductase n=1 Tax=Paraburkholderia sp. BL9I2N2 TaxID=1938809 RepID=UPI001FB34168|nr:Ldh family oxidoreductase [Paraburkholderia sp. BL9I2N2]